MKLFVWGTVLRGEHNHGVFQSLAKPTFIGERIINHICGELYEVNDVGMERMKSFEATANFIPVILAQEDKENIYMFVQSPAHPSNSWYHGQKIVDRIKKANKK